MISAEGTPMVSKRKTAISGWVASILRAMAVLPEPDAPVRMMSLGFIAGLLRDAWLRALQFMPAHKGIDTLVGRVRLPNGLVLKIWLRKCPPSITSSH